jgi:hypothetical protein
MTKRQTYKITTTFKFSNGETSSTFTIVNSKAAVARKAADIKTWMQIHNRAIISIDVSQV